MDGPHARFDADIGMVGRFRLHYWVTNVVLFVCLTVPSLLIPTAGWPLRAAVAAGLIGACVWEGVALRLRRFPVWADALETVAIALAAWRYPTGIGGARVCPCLRAPRAGVSDNLQHDGTGRGAHPDRPRRDLRRLDPERRDTHTQGAAGALAAVLVAFLFTEVARLVGLRAALAHRQQVADQLSGDLAAAKGRKDVHAAMLRAVLELLHGRTDARVIIWDEPDSLRPSAAAGANADEVRTVGGEPLSVVPWVREAIEAGESTYRESFDVDELRSALGFEPIPGVVFIVPLRHREQIRALSVAAREPIPPAVRADIEYVAKVGEIALGSIELTREGLEGLRERNYYDPGTRLANRELLRLRLEQALEQPDRLVAVLLIHIDRFPDDRRVARKHGRRRCAVHAYRSAGRRRPAPRNDRPVRK